MSSYLVTSSPGLHQTNVTVTREANGNLTPESASSVNPELTPSSFVLPPSNAHGPAPVTGVSVTRPTASPPSTTGCAGCQAIDAATGGNGVAVVIGIALVIGIVALYLVVRE